MHVLFATLPPPSFHGSLVHLNSLFGLFYLYKEFKANKWDKILKMFRQVYTVIKILGGRDAFFFWVLPSTMKGETNSEFLCINLWKLVLHANTQANGQFYTCPVHNARGSTAEHTPILKIQNQQCYCTKGRFTILVKLPLWESCN